MDIYSIERPDGASYDETAGVVVMARTETKARELASEVHGDEGANLWFTGFVTVTFLGFASEANEERVVLRDFHAG